MSFKRGGWVGGGAKSLQEMNVGQRDALWSDGTEDEEARRGAAALSVGCVRP